MQIGAPGRTASRTRGDTRRDPGGVLLDRGTARAACRGADFALPPVVEGEQLIGVPMLLVVVDQARIRGRRDDTVVRAAELHVARVAVEHDSRPPLVANGGERLEPRQRVEQVPRQELLRTLHRRARSAVLVAPVRADLRHTREVEVEVGRQAGGSRGAGEDDPQHVCVRVLREQRAEVQELGGGLGREPARACIRSAARTRGRAASERRPPPARAARDRAAASSRA